VLAQTLDGASQGRTDEAANIREPFAGFSRLPQRNLPDANHRGSYDRMGPGQRARRRHPRQSQPPQRLTNFEPVGEGRTRVTIWVDMHDLGDSMASTRSARSKSMANSAVCWTRTTGR
jgi:hypothetical protein